jgi:hypothetical protein
MLQQLQRKKEKGAKDARKSSSSSSTAELEGSPAEDGNLDEVLKEFDKNIVKVKTLTSDDLTAAGISSEVSNPESCGRSVEPWEATASCLITLPVKTAPKSWHDDNGRLDRDKCLQGMQCELLTINSALRQDYQLNPQKLHIMCCVERPFNRRDLENTIIEDCEISEHVHFAVKYSGRQTKQMWLWSSALTRRKYVANVVTFEQVLDLIW